MVEAFRFIQLVIAKTLKKARFAAIRNSKVHPTSKIESGTSFVASFIDRYSFCGYDCDIYHTNVGSFTSIANNVVVGGARHPMEWVGMSPVFYAGRDSVKAKFSQHPLDNPLKTLIGNDVWIGRSAIILSGVNIGNGAVVGAGSVVTKDVPSYAIVAGNPAKLIRYRFETSVIEELERIKWWTFPEEQLAGLANYIKDPGLFIDLFQQKVSSQSPSNLID